jgi:hypothetical protein
MRKTAYPSPEREPADDELEAGMLLLRPFDRGVDVVELSFPFVVLTAAGPHSPEVESQRGHVGGLQSPRRAEDDLVVERTAAERMGVADHSDRCRVLEIAIDSLQAAGGAVEIDVTQRFGIHGSLTRMRSPSICSS